VLPNSAADQQPDRVEQRYTSKAPLLTIGKSEAGSNEQVIPRADDPTTSADRQRHEENVGEGHRNRRQVRTVHRSDTYARRDAIDGRSGWCENSYWHRDRYDNGYARRDNDAFGRGNRDKNSRSRQSPGVFGTFVWH